MQDIIVHVKLSGVRQGEAFLSRDFDLTEKKTTILIGRSSSRRHQSASPDKHNAYFSCAVVSRRHAELYLSPEGTIKIKDLGSLHGTSVNGQKCIASRPQAVHDNDIISIGTSLLDGPTKYLAVVFQVNIQNKEQPDSGVQQIDACEKSRSFIDLSSPVCSPHLATAPSLSAVPQQSNPISRETYSVPDLESPSNDNGLDEGDEDKAVETLDTFESTASNAAFHGHSLHALTHLYGDGPVAVSVTDSEEEWPEEDLFTPGSKAGSSPPTSPFQDRAADGSSESEGSHYPLEKQVQENVGSVAAFQHPSQDSSSFNPFETRQQSGQPTRGSSFEVLDRQEVNEYHSFFPVHGLARGPTQPRPSFNPCTLPTDRARNTDAFQDFYSSWDTTANLLQASLEPKNDTLGTIKDRMAIESIVAKDVDSVPSRKRKAAELSVQDCAPAIELAIEHEMGSLGVSEAENVETSSITPTRSLAQPPSKRARMAAPIVVAPEGRCSYQNINWASFASGAAAGAVTLLGALVLLPESMFS